MGASNMGFGAEKGGIKTKLRYKIWDKSKKKMLYWGSDFGYVTSHGVVALNNGGMVMPPYAETLLYSGLPDKNGKEICEGDIVKCFVGHFEEEFVCKVVWNNGGLFFEPVVPADFPQKFVIWEYIIDPIVIGNVYENSEIIKKEE